MLVRVEIPQIRDRLKVRPLTGGPPVEVLPKFGGLLNEKRRKAMLCSLRHSLDSRQRVSATKVTDYELCKLALCHETFAAAMGVP